MVVETMGRYLGLLLWAALPPGRKSLMAPLHEQVLEALARNVVRPTAVKDKFNTGSIILHGELDMYGSRPLPEPIQFEVEERYRVDQRVDPDARRDSVFTVNNVFISRLGNSTVLSPELVEESLKAVYEGRPLSDNVQRRLSAIIEAG
jgi:hypothetical protein